MSADGEARFSREDFEIQRLVEAAERRGFERGRTEEEQRSFSQRLGTVELDMRETKATVSDIKTMLAAHFGTSSSQSAPATPPAAASSPQSLAGFAGLASKAMDLVKLFLWALVLMAAGLVVSQGGPLAAKLAERGIAGG